MDRPSTILRIIAVTLVLLTGVAIAQTQEQDSAAPLSLPPGTVLTVRIDQALSSDRNHAGDSFSATLVQPLVAQGIVVAQRGQTVIGRVVDVKRARGFSGNSSLQLALTRVTLVDGQTIPIHTELVVDRGRSSTGRDVGAIGATTATGAIIGAAAGRGSGAAIGAGAGAAAGIIGVLATRGYATVVYPESLLTFETTITASIDTSAAPQAFHAVDPSTYERNAQPQLEPPRRAEVIEEEEPVVVERRPAVIYRPYPVYYDPYCDPYWYPYCYGPRVSVIVGRPYYRSYYPRYYGPRYYGPRRYHRPEIVVAPRHYDRDYRRVDYRHDYGRGGGGHDYGRGGGGRGNDYSHGNGRGSGGGSGHGSGGNGGGGHGRHR